MWRSGTGTETAVRIWRWPAPEDAIFVLEGDGTGRLKQTATLSMGANPHGLVATDFNGDGLTDLAASARSAGELTVFLGDGKGGFNPLPVIKTAQDIIAIAAADFDRDEKVDLSLVSASHNAVVLLRGDGTGGFSPFAAPRAAKR